MPETRQFRYKQSNLPAEYTYASITENIDQAEKRRRITSSIKSFFVCPEKIARGLSSSSRFGGSQTDFNSRGVISGTVLVNVVTDTGDVSPGKIAVVDYNTGKNVMAKKEEWGTDECFIVGVFESEVVNGKAVLRVLGNSSSGSDIRIGSAFNVIPSGLPEELVGSGGGITNSKNVNPGINRESISPDSIACYSLNTVPASSTVIYTRIGDFYFVLDYSCNMLY